MQKFIFSISLIVLTSISFSQSKWKLKKDLDSIKIYTRTLPNQKFDEYKAITTINTSIENVVEELISAPEYYKNCPSGISYHLRQTEANQHIFYAHKDLPWPVKDRDIITLLTIKKISDSKYKLKLESLPNAIPQKEKTIRIKELMGFWLLEEMNDVTKVTQQLFVNPEGSLPTFVVNSLLIKGPFKTFSELREVLKSS